MVHVRFKYRDEFCRDDRDFTPETAVRLRIALLGTLAQLVEHLPCKQGVIGSSPIRSTKHWIGMQEAKAG